MMRIEAPVKLPQVRPFKRAAQESGFSYTTLRDAHFRGELAVIRVGRSWYVEIAELARFVERHTEKRATDGTVMPPAPAADVAHRLTPLDHQYSDHVIDKVAERENGYEVSHDGWTLWCDKVPGIIPKPGDTLRMWGRGYGYPVRGVAINGQIVRYETDADMRARQARDIEESNRKRRTEAEAKRDETEARYRALPEVFQRRLDRFRAGHPDFWWQHQDYELFCCEQALAIAAALPNVTAVRKFASHNWEKQKQLVPALSDGHSGNTFGMACRLAYWYLTNPENVVREHGALTPLVGCIDYGCTHTENGS